MSAGLLKGGDAGLIWGFGEPEITETGMSTSVVYRALGIRGYQHQSIRQQSGDVQVKSEFDLRQYLSVDDGAV